MVMTMRRHEKGIIDLTLRVVVESPLSGKTLEDVVDDILERALHSSVSTGLYTEGFVAAECVERDWVHKWEEIKEEAV